MTTTTAAGATVRVSAERGSTAVITESLSPDSLEGDTDISLATPDDKALGMDPIAKADGYAASGHSVVLDAMAIGMTYEQAVAEFGDMEAPSVPNRTNAHGAFGLRPPTYGTGDPVNSAMPAAAFTRAPTALAPSLTKSGGTPAPYDSGCSEIRYSSNKYSRSCYIRYLDYAVNGQWYLSHKLKSTSKYATFLSSLTSSRVTLTYASGGAGNGGRGTEWVDWDPYTTQTVGSCGQVTVGVSDPKTGANVSYAGTVCPSKMGPYFGTYIQGTYKGFGSQWNGKSQDARGTIGVGIVNNPPGSSSSMRVSTRFSWFANA